MARIRRYAFWVWLLLGVFTLVGLCAGAGDRQQSGVLSQLEHDGVLVEGQVAGRRQEGGSNKEPVSYFVSYRFPVDGEAVTREREVGHHQWQQAREGDRVAVRYSRSDPRVWDFPGGPTAADVRESAARWFAASGVAGAAFVLLGVALHHLKHRSPTRPAGRGFPP